MVFYDSWATFEPAASNLYSGSPSTTRYTVKYRNCDASLTLKVTDNATCVQLRTERFEDIRRMAALHRKLAHKISQRSREIGALNPILPARESQAPQTRHAPQAPSSSEDVVIGVDKKSKSKKKSRGKKRH